MESRRRLQDWHHLLIMFLVMAVVIFLVLILVALVSLEASPSRAVSRDRGVSQVEPGQRLAALHRKLNGRNEQHGKIRPILADKHKPLLALGNPAASQ
jgi:hypothetical protein